MKDMPAHLPEIITAHDDLTASGPQLVGLIDKDAQAAGIHDPRSISFERDGNVHLIFTPIEYQPEANQEFFEDNDAFYFNWLETANLSEYEMRSIVEGFALLPSGTRILIEKASGDTRPTDLLGQIAADAEIHVEVDEKIFDSENGSVAAVHHFYSDLDREKIPEETFPTYEEAYEYVKAQGLWDAFEENHIRFIGGADIDQETLDKMWAAYDETFDLLVENHPSAQKQPREYFDEQLLSPQSKVVFAEDESGIVSELFLVDGINGCAWLREDFFAKINPQGRTVYLPGISTRLDKRGLRYSPLLISAMSLISEYVDGVTGAATQCTNRSVEYIPRLTRENTAGSTNLDLAPTMTYEYPVYKII